MDLQEKRRVWHNESRDKGKLIGNLPDWVSQHVTLACNQRHLRKEPLTSLELQGCTVFCHMAQNRYYLRMKQSITQMSKQKKFWLNRDCAIYLNSVLLV